jgi:membrane protein
MQAPDEAPGASQAEQAAPAHGTAGSGRPGTGVAGRPGVQRARRAAEWGKQKYAGSWAEYLWNRLNAVDFINQGMLFAATLLLCFFPFLIVGNALAGRSTAAGLARHAGLNRQAAADFGHLFAPAATTSNAVTGTGSVVFFVLGGIAAATALQQLYERIFDLDSRGMKDVWRRLIWLGLLIGASLLTGWAGRALHHAVGPVLLGIAAVAYTTAFWWLTLWILLGGRISWRRLFPSACATGVFWVGMVVVFSFFFSNMVISENKEYGPIGVIFAMMTFLIAIGVVIILGAVVGLVWQERGLSFAAAFSKLRRAS